MQALRWWSTSDTSLMPAPYSYEPSGTESDNSESDDSSSGDSEDDIHHGKPFAPKWLLSIL